MIHKIEEKVREIIIDQLSPDPAKVVPSARYVEDLSADSLDAVELMLAFEEEFGFAIDDEDASRVSTVGQTVALVAAIQAHAWFTGDPIPEYEDRNSYALAGDLGRSLDDCKAKVEAWPKQPAPKTAVADVIIPAPYPLDKMFEPAGDRRKLWNDMISGDTNAFLLGVSGNGPRQDARINAMNRVIADIWHERDRQVLPEGYTPEKDDATYQGNGDLGFAGASYAEAGATGVNGWKGDSQAMPANWPFAPACWKPADPRRMLIKAAALIVAQIEQLDRRNPPATAFPGWKGVDFSTEYYAELEAKATALGMSIEDYWRKETQGDHAPIPDRTSGEHPNEALERQMAERDKS